MNTTMKKTIATLAFAVALATAATPALARVHRPAGPPAFSQTYPGTPSSWNDIEVSHPEGGM